MIPLVRSNSVEDINTSLIATRREIENGGSGSGSSMSNGNMNVNVNVIYDIIDEVKTGSGLPVTSNAVAESLSYSTTEQKTGGKWIDGKMIYRKVCTNCTTSGSTDSWNNLGVTISGIDKIISHTAINPTDNVSCNLFLLKALSNGTIQYWVWSAIPMNNGLTTTFIIEYTKTTDA